MKFIAKPTGRNWYHAHNASIVGGYLEHRELADAESLPERFFMNVALARSSMPTRSLARRALRSADSPRSPRVLADPRLGMAGAFLSLGRVLPDRYPLEWDVESYLADERRLGRLLDYAVILPTAPTRVRVVRRRARRAPPARIGSRRQPDLCVALRAATRVALAGHPAGDAS